MKNKLEIFKKAPDLLDEPEVQELLDYCERLEDELVDLKFEKEKSKELIMLDMKRLQGYRKRTVETRTIWL